MEIDVKPNRIIDLTEYGLSGEITLEAPGFFKKKQFQNNVGKCTHFKDIEMKEIESQDIGDMMIYRVMQFIVTAPFKFESIDGFYKFMERVDKVKFGNADKLFEAMQKACAELEEDKNRPLEESQEKAQTSNGEPEDSQRQ